MPNCQVANLAAKLPNWHAKLPNWQFGMQFGNLFNNFAIKCQIAKLDQFGSQIAQFGNLAALNKSSKKNSAKLLNWIYILKNIFGELQEFCIQQYIL